MFHILCHFRQTNHIQRFFEISFRMHKHIIFKFSSFALVVVYQFFGGIFKFEISEWFCQISENYSIRNDFHKLIAERWTRCFVHLSNQMWKGFEKKGIRDTKMKMNKNRIDASLPQFGTSMQFLCSEFYVQIDFSAMDHVLWVHMQTNIIYEACLIFSCKCVCVCVVK